MLQVVGFDVGRELREARGAVTLLAFWFLTYFETAAWVMAVALIIPWVDAYSVWRGPTKHIIEQRRELFTTLSFAFPVPGEQSTAQLGLPDLMFFALFLAATARSGCAPADVDRDGASFGATMALAVCFDVNGLPALPLLSLGFLLPNADLLWKRPAPRTRGAAPTGNEEPAASVPVARPSRCAACAGTCPRVGRVPACSPTRPGAP